MNVVLRVTLERGLPFFCLRGLKLEKEYVLSLFDESGNMVKPRADVGYTCICVDIKHQGQRKDGNIIYFGTNIVGWLPPLAKYKIVFAFPPCTHLAVAGSTHFQSKGLSKLIEGLTTFQEAIKIGKWSRAPYMVENPVAVLSTHFRKPDYYFDPYEYGGYLNSTEDAYTKRTCLWTGGGFVMPNKKPIAPTDGSKMRLLPPSKDRARLRSLTPMGFATAVYEANK